MNSPVGMPRWLGRYAGVAQLMPRRSTTPTAGQAHKCAGRVHAQAFDEGGASFVHLVFSVNVVASWPQSRDNRARRG